jgi:hypothetical protein
VASRRQARQGRRTSDWSPASVSAYVVCRGLGIGIGNACVQVRRVGPVMRPVCRSLRTVILSPLGAPKNSVARTSEVPHSCRIGRMQLSSTEPVEGGIRQNSGDRRANNLSLVIPRALGMPRADDGHWEGPHGSTGLPAPKSPTPGWTGATRRLQEEPEPFNRSRLDRSHGIYSRSTMADRLVANTSSVKRPRSGGGQPASSTARRDRRRGLLQGPEPVLASE